MAYKRERTILLEFIELYCQLPCLWDMDSDIYKDRNQKAEAWDLLTEKLMELEPKASVVAAKKKIEHFRTAYKREAKKVRESRRISSGAGGVYKPSLWYYSLLNSILGDDEDRIDKEDEEDKREPDPLASDEEFEEREPVKIRNNKVTRKSHTYNRVLEWKKQKKIIHATQERMRQGHPRDNKRQNSFLIYVEEQLDEVDMFQRNVAEKLISEVLFLAKTGNLTLETKIGTPSNSRSHYSQCRSPQIVQTTTPQSIKESSSPQHVIPSPSYQFIQPSPSHASGSPRQVQLSDSVLIEEQDTEDPDQSVLKELLVHRKAK